MYDNEDKLLALMRCTYKISSILEKNKNGPVAQLQYIQYFKVMKFIPEPIQKVSLLEIYLYNSAILHEV